MAKPLHRIVTLTENGNGHPHPSQFPPGDIDVSKVSMIYHGDGTRFYIAFNPDPKSNWRWPGGGHWPRYIAYRHSAGLYCLFFRPGAGGFRTDWAEESPRDGLRGYPFCNVADHPWRAFRCSGYDNTDPENPVWIQEQPKRFGAGVDVPTCAEVTPSTPWEIGVYEIHEIIPSILHTLAGFDLPEYTSHVSDEENGDELD